MSAFEKWLESLATSRQQKNTIEKTLVNANLLYARYAAAVMAALCSDTATGIIKPVDLSEVACMNDSVPGQFVFHVTIVRGSGANPAVEASIKSAIYNQLSREFNVELAVVKKAHRISVIGDNIIIKY